MKNNVFTFEEIAYTDSLKLQHGRKLFLSYFGDLYTNMNSDQLQINGNAGDYLVSIFDKTEQSLKNDPSLHAVLIHQNHTPIAFATFGLLEDSSSVLIRTIAIDIDHKVVEKAIRLECISFITQKYPRISEIIMMIRNANIEHQEIIQSIGFQNNENVFNASLYINKNYDRRSYRGFSYLIVT